MPEAIPVKLRRRRRLSPSLSVINGELNRAPLEFNRI